MDRVSVILVSRAIKLACSSEDRVPLSFSLANKGAKSFIFLANVLRSTLFAYGGFSVALVTIGWITYAGLKFFENRKINNKSASNRRVA